MKFNNKSFSSDFSSAQAIKNLASNALFFLFQTLISLWYTPFLLWNLGSNLYGFIPLATSVTNYFSIITYSLNISVGRHITIELEKGKISQANKMFNANLFATLILISLSIPLGIVLVILAPRIFNIPNEFISAVKFLFSCVIVSFLLSTYRTNYSLATFAKNRFDLRNFVALSSRIVQILIVIILFSMRQPNLFHIGIGILLASLFNLMGNYYLWRKLLPALKVRWSDLYGKNLRLLFSTSIWSFIYQAGFILFLNMDMLVANRFLDLKLAGMYGALLVIPKNLRIFSQAISGIWGPTFLSKFSQSDHHGMDRVVLTSLKITGLAIALLVGLICGLAKPFLIIWLGSDFESMQWLFVLMVFPLSTNLTNIIFYNIHVSLNNLKVPALATLGLSALNLGLATLLTPRYGTGGLIIAGAITFTLNYSILFPIYAAKIMKHRWWHYMKQLGTFFMVTLGISIFTYLIGETILIKSITGLLFTGGVISLGYLSLVYFFGLTNDEKSSLVTLIRSAHN